MPNDYIKCEKCWRPAYILPCGILYIIYPRTPQGQQDKFVANLCIAHLRILREWITSNKIKLPKEIPLSQTRIDK